MVPVLEKIDIGTEENSDTIAARPHRIVHKQEAKIDKNESSG